jgi:tripartite-type tricarboxylate transporter receptor subunit TctC
MSHRILWLPDVFAAILLLASATLFPDRTFAADYPTKPIRLVVPQPPGGGADIIARMLAQKLGASLKQEIVVDNRGGAGGIVGTELVAHTPADGYTLLLGYTGSLTINPNIYKQLPYRPLEDFDPVSLAAASPFLMVVHPSLRVTSVAELVALAKKRAAPLNYSSPGNGSLHQLSMEWFKSALGVNFTHIPYKGSQSINAVIAGEVALTFASVVGMLPHVKSGRVVAIAITSKDRFRLLPDLPTVAESGLLGFEATNWFGILTPRGTPRTIVVTLSSLIAGNMKSAELKERLFNDGADPIGSTPEEFTALIKTELARWAQVIKISGAKVD